jgi:hypothetical protein
MNDDFKICVAFSLGFFILWILGTLRAVLNSHEPKQTLKSCLFNPSTSEGLLVFIGFVASWMLGFCWIVYLIFCLL